jgi:hypothetical protein
LGLTKNISDEVVGKKHFELVEDGGDGSVKEVLRPRSEFALEENESDGMRHRARMRARKSGSRYRRRMSTIEVPGVSSARDDARSWRSSCGPPELLGEC